MDPYAGFEPQVGEIRALRTFRLGPGGVLYPLFVDEPWVDGANTASCRRARRDAGTGAACSSRHAAPDPNCTCGFYAYGSERAAGEYPQGRHVLAVVACWGRVIAGTRGLRAEFCRIEALWLSDAVPEELVGLVRDGYPSTAVYRDRARMLAQHPVTELDCYEAPAAPGRSLGERLLVAGALAAVVTGVLPAVWLGGPHWAALIWASLGAVFLIVALTRGWRGATDVAAHRQLLVSLAVVVWLLAPFAGPAGVVFLRLPLLELVVLMSIRHVGIVRAAGRFPAAIG
jgi:hypothetical protein